MKAEETNERYLEEIYFLCQKSDGVHAIDVCKAMGYSKPTVSVKLKQLAHEGYLTIDASEHLSLTQQGLKIAERMSERHLLLTKLLTDLGVTPSVAEDDACKIEHDLSDESFQKIKEHFLCE